jgi:hypothetical protein
LKKIVFLKKFRLFFEFLKQRTEKRNSKKGEKQKKEKKRGCAGPTPNLGCAAPDPHQSCHLQRGGQNERSKCSRASVSVASWTRKLSFLSARPFAPGIARAAETHIIFLPFFSFSFKHSWNMVLRKLTHSLGHGLHKLIHS